MTQALHIFRKDLRRGWPLLLLWASVLVFWVAPAWQDPLDREDVLRNAGLEALLMPLAAMIATALVVHLDSLVGLREFWMTRPIRPWSLMAAKALFVVVFFIIPPVLIQFAVLVRYGLPSDRWPSQLAVLASPWSSLVAFAALLGAWTKGLPGFFVLFFGLLLGPQFLHGVINQFRDDQVGLHTTSAPLTIVGLVALALIALQYGTRRRRLGWLIGGAAGLTMMFAPLPLSPVGYVGPASSPNLGEIRMELRPGLDRETFLATRPERPEIFAAELWFRPLPIEAPASSFLTISGGGGTIEWLDGSSSRFALRGVWSFLHPGVPLDGFLSIDEPASALAWGRLLILGNEEIESILGHRGRLHGRAYGSLWTRSDVRALRLETGAETAHGDYKARFTQIDRYPQRFAIHIREREIARASPAARSMAPRIFLANRARNEVIPLKYEPPTVRQIHTGLLGWAELSLREEIWTLEDTARPPSPDWLADAEALVVFYEYAGAYDVRLEAADLAVDPMESPQPVGWREGEL